VADADHRYTQGESYQDDEKDGPGERGGWNTEGGGGIPLARYINLVVQ
jgi:hypothetical protein